MLLGTLGTGLFGNMLAGKGIKRPASDNKGEQYTNWAESAFCSRKYFGLRVLASFRHKEEKKNSDKKN